MHLKLGRKCKKDYMKVRENKAGLDYRIVNKIMCFLEGLFQRSVNLDAQ